MLMMFQAISWAQLKICGNCEEAQAEASWLCTSFSFDCREKSVDCCMCMTIAALGGQEVAHNLWSETGSCVSD
jgi:hypothetical protein